MNDATPQKPDKFRRYRARKKAQGLREIRMWVPDVNRPGFQEELERQIAVINASAENEEILEWLDAAVAETWKDID